jgi:hypothetical protein
VGSVNGRGKTSFDSESTKKMPIHGAGLEWVVGQWHTFEECIHTIEKTHR